MKTFFQQTLTFLGHLSDETITKLIDGELSPMHEFRAKAHLGKCWQCKARRETLEKAAFQVVEYRKHQLERRLPLSPKRREMFFERLDDVLEETATAPWLSRMLLQLRSASTPHMNPVFASTFVIVAAIVLLVVIWQRDAAPVSPSVFLEKAAQAEARQSNPTLAGVIYQKVEIKTKSKTFERSLYRDMSHKRRPRAELMEAEEAAVRKELDAAGVDWQQPLSAEEFKEWHNRQVAAEDIVRRSGNDLLTLTTALPSGPIAAESLTVRAQDFHAVSRTVSMRDDENIEIAEVHYDVLGWDAVNVTLFEPLGGSVTIPSIASVLPHLPSPEQLDLAELQARLVLNRLHADSTEQLEFLRSKTSVEIRGVVESNARKQELLSQLRAVPHVVPAIFSVDELRAHAETGSAVSSIRAYSTVDKASPLEQLFRAQGKGTEMLNAISEQLLDAALSVKQESSAIAELYRRFGDGEHLNKDGKSTLQQLLVTHASRLRQAVDVENGILSENGIARPEVYATNLPSTAEAEPLTTNAQSNMALAKELITGKDGTQRDARQIAAELFQSTQELRSSIHGIADSNTNSGETSSPLAQKR